jgi:DNA transformation protein
MVVSADFNEFVLEQLGQVAKTTSRRMFGGVGYYADGLFFAIADNDSLYFKVDAVTQSDFEAEGMKPFRPFGPESAPMGYWEVPAGVLDSSDDLETWMKKALGVALRAAAKKPKRAVTKKPVKKKARPAGSGRGPSSSRS